MALTLALISDLHFGPEAHFGGKLRKLTAQAPLLARAFVARMNDEVRPDLVVNLGDDIEDENLAADRARYAECVGILRGVQAELVHVAGNHDTIYQSAADLHAAWGRCVNHGGTPSEPGAPLLSPVSHGSAAGEPGAPLLPSGAPLYSSFERGNFHFIVLHTRERKDLDVSIGPEQLEWLAADLAAQRGPTIVLMHHSAADQDLRGNRWFEGSPHLCLVRERRAMRQLFFQHGNVRAVFNGHLHWNHLDLIEGIPFVTLQSLIENLDEDAPGRPAAAYAVVRVTDKRIVVEIEGAERARYQFDTRRA